MKMMEENQSCNIFINMSICAPMPKNVKILLNDYLLHGDGTNHAAKKGGDNLGFNAHKRIKGDKVVVVCDRNVNVIAPFIEAPGNRNEAILLNPCLKENESNGG